MECFDRQGQGHLGWKRRSQVLGREWTANWLGHRTLLVTARACLRCDTTATIRRQAILVFANEETCLHELRDLFLRLRERRTKLGYLVPRAATRSRRTENTAATTKQGRVEVLEPTTQCNRNEHRYAPATRWAITTPRFQKTAGAVTRVGEARNRVYCTKAVLDVLEENRRFHRYSCNSLLRDS